MDKRILLNLRGYMSLCGNSDEKEARRKVNLDLEVLSALCISYSGMEKKSVKCNDMNLFDEATVKNSIIRVTLSDEFAKILSKAYPMPFPLVLFRIKSDKYP